MSRLSRISILAAIAITSLPNSSPAAGDGTGYAAATPPLKPSITRLHGPYAGIICGGQSVSVSHGDGVAAVGNRRLSAIAGIVGGYQWRASGGPAPVYWGAEADLVSIPLLQGAVPGQQDWQTSIRARYGVNLFDNVLVYGTAGIAAGPGNPGNAPLVPALIAGSGIENVAPSGIRTRLEYLYSHDINGSGNHQVRAAFMVAFKN